MWFAILIRFSFVSQVSHFTDQFEEFRLGFDGRFHFIDCCDVGFKEFTRITTLDFIPGLLIVSSIGEEPTLSFFWRGPQWTKRVTKIANRIVRLELRHIHAGDALHAERRKDFLLHKIH